MFEFFTFFHLGAIGISSTSLNQNSRGIFPPENSNGWQMKLPFFWAAYLLIFRGEIAVSCKE